MQLAAGQLDNDLLRLDQAALLLVLTFLLATCTQSVEGPPATAAWRQLEDLGEPWQQLGRAKRYVLMNSSLTGTNWLPVVLKHGPTGFLVTALGLTKTSMHVPVYR